VKKIKVLWLLPVVLFPFAKFTAPGQKQPIRARRSVLAVSIMFLNVLIPSLVQHANIQTKLKIAGEMQLC